MALPPVPPVPPRGPVLVSGVPRSGQTWVARLLATAPGTALPGREPMNPHRGQYGLAGTLRTWESLASLSPRQQRALSTAYRGLNPRVYSRYGRRQWRAPLPGTRVVFKDPFALLSLPAVTRATGATAVVVYRHPGAVLASYRRMGWQPDTAAIQPLVDRRNRDLGEHRHPDQVPRTDPDEVGRLVAFWAALYGMLLDDLPSVGSWLLVSHAELAAGGPEAGRRLFAALGLPWTPASAAELRPGDGATAVSAATASRAPGTAAAPQGLHDFARDPAQVAESWRSRLTPQELSVVEERTADVRARLEAARTVLRD